MILYHSPGSCSLGIRIILGELAIPHEIRIVNLRRSEQTSPAFLKINPKAKIPVLIRDDGTVMTEYTSISFWLARQDPEGRLLASDAECQARTLELMEYVVGTVHGQGFMRMWFPEGFSPSSQDREKVVKRGRRIFEAGLNYLDAQIGTRQYAVDTYSIADIAIFYVMHWAVDRFAISLPQYCAGLYERLLERAAVRNVIRDDQELRRSLFGST